MTAFEINTIWMGDNRRGEKVREGAKEGFVEEGYRQIGIREDKGNLSRPRHDPGFLADILS